MLLVRAERIGELEPPSSRTSRVQQTLSAMAYLFGEVVENVASVVREDDPFTRLVYVEQVVDDFGKIETLAATAASQMETLCDE